MLKNPARYFPIEKGLYEVAPGLRSLGQAMGNGKRDSLVFQFDDAFEKYRKNKIACRAERLSKYTCLSNYSAEVSAAVNRFLIDRLVMEHPDFFAIRPRSDEGFDLVCSLTRETISLDENYEYCSQVKSTPYISAFDAVCAQIQEDVAVMSVDDEGNNWLSAIHLCSPSHWAAEDKIGKTFSEIHAPVPGIEKMNRASSSLVDAIINKGPYVRFVWGFGTDQRLNHHPIPPPGVALEGWRGRTFRLIPGSAESPFSLRVERQVLFGLPAVKSSVFTIRTYFIDGEEIRSRPTERALLRSGLLSMTPESRTYKGLADCMGEVVAWLDEK